MLVEQFSAIVSNIIQLGFWDSYIPEGMLGTDGVAWVSSVSFEEFAGGVAEVLGSSAAVTQ